MKILPNSAKQIEIISDAIVRQGDLVFKPSDVIHTFVGGSDLHGASVGSDDLDLFGVFIEPPKYVFGVHASDSWETFVWSTAPDTRKNTRDDIDVCLHSLRKWSRLAINGNPTIIHFLFTDAQDSDWTWQEIVRSRDLFLANTHVASFLGYAKAQMLRLNGKLARDTNRPELVEKYGYDTKMAMHMIRLMFECEELLMDGHITLPNPRKDQLIEIRTGKHTLEALNQWYQQLVDSCKYWEEKSVLPKIIDRDKINKLLVRLYCEFFMDHYR
jgi:predicted nucleotidyltransferase